MAISWTQHSDRFYSNAFIYWKCTSMWIFAFHFHLNRIKELAHENWIHPMPFHTCFWLRSVRFGSVVYGYTHTQSQRLFCRIIHKQNTDLYTETVHKQTLGDSIVCGWKQIWIALISSWLNACFSHWTLSTRTYVTISVCRNSKPLVKVPTKRPLRSFRTVGVCAS